MATSTWTDADLARIKRAIASGARSVTYADGKSVTYRSLDEMAAVRQQIEAELGLRRGPLRRVAASSKGTRPGGSLDRRERGGW